MANTVEIPSNESESNECSLIFEVPEDMDEEHIDQVVCEAIAGANDDNGERSEEVIRELEGKGFKFLGNPEFVEQWPTGPKYIITDPWI